MQQRPGEITISHLQPIIERPKRSSEAIAQPREPTTRSGVGFEHHEWFTGGLSDGCRVEVRRDDLTACIVI